MKCPHCQKDSSFEKENTYRPFCSEKCKMIDLGEWFEENYKVPSEENPAISFFESEDDEYS